jgi:hypothetical protein
MVAAESVGLTSRQTQRGGRRRPERAVRPESNRVPHTSSLNYNRQQLTSGRSRRNGRIGKDLEVGKVWMIRCRVTVRVGGSSSVS